MKYVPRLTCPSKDNKYYVNGNYNVYAYNYNMFKMNGNCTTYCYGRWAELLDKKPNLCPNQAENWWRYKDGYERGQTPKLGAIAVWSQGSQFNPRDGYGHVAIVEKVFENGDFTASESGMKSYLFKTTKYEAPNYPRINSNFKFLGFIYLPLEFEEKTPSQPQQSVEKYTKGNYITLEDMNIRSGAGYKYAIKKVSQMSVNGKKHATSTNLNANAVYKKNTEFTAQEIITKGNEVWAKTPSGYICLKGSSGKVYCKKK